MNMLNALIEGTATAEEMARLARRRLRRKRAAPTLAFEGGVEAHNRFLLAMQLHRLEVAEHDIAALDQRIDDKLEPYRGEHALLKRWLEPLGYVVTLQSKATSAA